MPSARSGTVEPGGWTRRLLSSAACLAMMSAAMVATGSGAALADSPGASATATAATTAVTSSGAFSAGDVVVYRVGDGSTSLSGSGAPVYLDEYSPTGSLLESVALPTTASGANKALVAGGSAASEGGLTLSADSRYLVATGYDAAVGTSGLSSSAAASVPRTIARVDASGDVDTSTALTDFADGNNPRSAVSSDGSGFWVGGAAGGVRYAPLGASTSTSLVSSSYKNVRQLEIVDGRLYASADPTKASVTVATVGTGLPTTGTSAVTNLPFATSPVEPYAYSLLTLGSGSTPDTLYVADNSAGAVVKYGLTGGTWVQQGSVAVSGVTGLTADDSDGTVTVYATSSGSAGTSGTLYRFTDSSGIGGTLSGTASVLATAPGNEAFRGVAYAPGTVIGTGGGSAPTTVSPTVSTAQTGLPAALGDPTNATLDVSVADAGFSADQLSVTATSSDPAVAPASGISVTGTGADRTLTVTPAAVGYSTITLTVTAPDGTSATTQVQYGVSANLGDAGQRYYSGAGNGSAAIDVGDGYMIVGDDESNVLHLYNESESGPAVKSFDFTGELPYGTSEVDIEAASRSGDMLYWTGSMSNNTDGKLEPSRSTLFAARITGSGADTQLTYVGSYTGLQSDLVAWDQDNGHGLGANYLGLADSVQSGVDGHGDDALNVEGMEFAGSSGSTAYLAFRAPLEPTTDRHLAMLVPVTNIDRLVADGNPGTTHATFGAPIFMDLGGLGIRDIKENADGQYLIIAGTADGSNSSFVLYSWDGKPSDPPLPTGTTLPLEPAGANQGSWETIVAVPDPLVAGAAVQLVQDDGDTAWYGDTVTSKTGLAPDLEKDLGQVFTYVPGTQLATATALSAQPEAPTAGQPVTYTATVSGAGGTPTGTVDFVNGGADVAGCSAQPLDATGTATCTTDYPATGSETVTADYSGDGSYAGSASDASTLGVGRSSATLGLTGSATAPVTGQSVTFTAVAAAPAGNALTPTGTVAFSADGSTLPGCAAVPVDATGTAQCTVPAGFAASQLMQPAQLSVTAAYSGDAAFAAANAGPLALTVAPAATAVTVTSAADPAPYGSQVTLTAQVAPVAPGGGTPTGSVVFTLNSGGADRKAHCAGQGTDAASGTVPVVDGSAVCVLSTVGVGQPGGGWTVTAAYSGSGDYTAASGTMALQLGLVPTSTKASLTPHTVTAGKPATVLVYVNGASSILGALSGQVAVTVTDASGAVVACQGTVAAGQGGSCTLSGSDLTVARSPYTVTAQYPGSQYFGASSGTTTFTVVAGQQ